MALSLDNKRSRSASMGEMVSASFEDDDSSSSLEAGEPVNNTKLHSKRRTTKMVVFKMKILTSN